MIVSQHAYYDFDWAQDSRVLAFVWKEATASMRDADFQAALEAYAGAVEKQGAIRGLVDLRGFRHRPGDGVGTWRDAHIIPRYNAAGVQRFAYVMPQGQEPPPLGQDGKPASPGEQFVTRYFATEKEARAWLGSA
jgi:SpoIIAA-like